MSKRNPSVATLAIVMLVTVATLLLGALGFISYMQESRDAHTALGWQASSTGDQLSAALALPLWNFDRPQVDKILDAAMHPPDVYAITVEQLDVSAPGGKSIKTRVRDSAGNITSSTANVSPDGMLVQERDIAESGERLGSVKIFITPGFVDERLHKSLLFLAGRIVLFDLILILSLYLLLRRTVLIPLRSIEQYASTMTSGGSRIPVPAGSRFSGEIESLRQSIEKMVTLLDERYTALAKSQTMVTTILNSVPQAIFWKDRNSVFLGCNQLYAREAGVEHPDKIIGKTDFDLWQRDVANEYRAFDQEVMQTAKPIRHIFKKHHFIDGRERWLDTSKVPLVDANGNVFGVLGIYDDITEQRQAEEARKVIEEEYRVLYEQSLVGITIFEVIYDANGYGTDFRLIRANPACDRLLDANFHDSVGKNERELDLRWSPELRDRLVALATNGGELYYERLNPRRGQYFEVRAFSPKKGQFALMFNDVTERRRAEKALLDSEKMRIVAGLAAGMAHEINNPLAGILQSAQVILNRVAANAPANRAAAEECGTTVEAIDRYLDRRGVMTLLQTICASGERAATIVANMLNFSRSNQTGVTACSLSEMLDQTLELARSDYDSQRNLDFRRINIKREYDGEMPPVECDTAEIQQVILNLLKNAAQALAGSDREQSQWTITLRTRREGNFARIEVQDNGPGIEAGLLESIFDPFFTTKSAGQGTGLGLSVSKFIIANNHAGQIEVESPPGEGAKFIIKLPFKHTVESVK